MALTRSAEAASGSGNPAGTAGRGEAGEKAFLFVLAYLLDKGMLRNRSLVFFIDGASNLLSNIAEMFAFHPYRVILDWYHLKKRCQEYSSMSFKSKEEKRRTLQKLLRILWDGNVTEGILYLRNLDRSLLRLNHRVTDLTGYLEKLDSEKFFEKKGITIP